MKRFSILSLTGAIGAALLGVGTLATGQTPLPSALPPLPTSTTPAYAPSPGAPTTADPAAKAKQEAADAERVKLWDGAEMRAARTWLAQYFARAKAVTPQQSQSYLAQLEKLPATQMKTWLERFQADRQRDAASRAVADRARQLSVEAALKAQQVRQEGYTGINRREGVLPRPMIGGLEAQREFALQMAKQNAQNRDATVVANTPGAAFATGPYFIAFPPDAPYWAAATNPFPDGINLADPREVRDAADIERSTREP